MASEPASNRAFRETRAETVLTKYRPLGGWIEKPAQLQPQLEGNTTADVVIAGAGFAGLSTALELAARGAAVTVLESAFAGFGASGRNAGYLAGAHGLKFDYFLKRVGHARAKQIVRFYEEGVSYVERKLGDYGIDCSYNPSGLIRAGIHPSQEKSLRKSMQTGIELGAPAQFLGPAEMRARGIPPAFLFGFLQSGGTLDPGEYVLGLRRAALEAGVKIHEQTALKSYSGGRSLTCKTDRGSVSAPFLVLATNAYTPQLGLLKDKIVPLRVSAIETEPLSAAQLAALGWPRREGIVTQHQTMESHRLTPRNTLLLTTKRLDYVYGSRTPNVPDDAAYRDLVLALHERFPALRDLAIRSCWSGYISLAYDTLPVAGAAGPQKNIFYAAGCAGHGVGTQSFMGKLLAERICGEESELFSSLQHKTPSTLPEPLQWCAVKSMLGLTGMLDKRINSKARRLTLS